MEQGEVEMPEINLIDALDMAYPIIKHFEGLYLDAYTCPAGVWTIGYGHTKGVKKGQKITEEQANKMLEEDATEAARDALSVCPKLYERPKCFAAVISFVYNLGKTKFQGSSLAKKINEGDWDGASNEFPKWKLSGGKVLKGLVDRRAAEQELFKKGY